MLDDGQVVADEEIGEAELAPQLGQKVEDLRLHRDVERAGRLVAHDDARAQHEGAGDGDALALAARQLGRQALAHLGATGRPAPASRRRACAISLRVDVALGTERHGDDVAHARQRVERGEGILEHRLDQPRAGAAIHVDDALALDRDVAGGRREQAQDQAGEGGLAAARFAHDAQHAAGAARRRRRRRRRRRVGRRPEARP